MQSLNVFMFYWCIAKIFYKDNKKICIFTDLFMKTGKPRTLHNISCAKREACNPAVTCWRPVFNLLKKSLKICVYKRFHQISDMDIIHCLNKIFVHLFFLSTLDNS